MPAHEGLVVHGAMPASTPPCHDAPASDTPDVPCSDAPYGVALHAACCASVGAPAAPMPERVHPLPLSLLTSAVASFVLPPEPTPSPPRSSGDPSAAAPVALHVLYGRFLT